MTASQVLRAPLRPVSWVGRKARERVGAWLRARVTPSDTHVLDQGNIYIVPTRAGLMFAVTVIVLLLSSINYQLNLGYVLTFLLAGSGLVSMHITHNTLRGLSLHLRAPAPVHAGEAAPLEIVLTGASTPRHGVGLRVESAPRDAITWVDVPAGGQVSARLSFVARQRGMQEVPALLAETRFPLGLFRAWTVWRPASKLLAYPAPEQPAPALPPVRATGLGRLQGRRREGVETEGVRAYRRGDAMKLVVWKKVAKYAGSSAEMVSRDTSASVHEELWFDYLHCGVVDTEARLSRLAAWVVKAERAGATYGLRLPGQELPPAHGDAHRRACLEALALWP
jgi:uncharacterized protein (DUF58 family)